jgi:hypothetical protein
MICLTHYTRSTYKAEILSGVVVFVGFSEDFDFVNLQWKRLSVGIG